MNKAKNKNKMNVEAMKRAAKVMMKGGGDLNAVVIDQKYMLEVIDKFIPTITNVGSALLKWSYTETNYTFPDVFSAWADLDVGFTLLLQEFINECTRYRKSFKDIIAETKKVSDIQKEKEKSAGKVASLQAKLDSAKKAAKKNEHNDKARLQVSNLESDLFSAKSKDDEMEEILRNSIADFEFYKASMLKESLTVHCQALMALLHKSADLCQTKLDIADAMPSAPASAPDSDAVNGRKVEEVFNKLHLQLPTRDVAVGRNLPMERFKTMPTPQSQHLGVPSPQTGRQSPQTLQNQRLSRPFAGVQVFGRTSDSESEEGEDDDDYMVPNEDMIASQSAKKTVPPQLPPRNVVEQEDEYVVPDLSPKPNTPNQFSPTRDSQKNYFQSAPDSHNGPPVRPSAFKTAKLPLIPREEPTDPSPDDESIYSAPAEDENDGGDNGDGDRQSAGQFYGNMSNKELIDHQKSNAVPAQPAGKPRKPAVYPKPQQRLSAAPPSPNRPDERNPVPEVTAEDDDIYSLVYEESSNDTGQTGVCPVAPSKPRSQSYRGGDLANGQPSADDGQPSSPVIQHTYMFMAQAKQCPNRAGAEADTSSADEGSAGETEQLYRNVPDVYRMEAEPAKASPEVARKPDITARKPRVPARAGVR